MNSAAAATAALGQGAGPAGFVLEWAREPLAPPPAVA